MLIATSSRILVINSKQSIEEGFARFGGQAILPNNNKNVKQYEKYIEINVAGGIGLESLCFML